jgi:hypothetical protein
MDCRKKATITRAQGVRCPLELGREDANSIRIATIFVIGPAQKSMRADKPIWFRHTRQYLVSGAVRVNAMTLPNFTELKLESEVGGGRSGGLHDDEATQFTLKNKAARNDRRSARDHH